MGFLAVVLALAWLNVTASPGASPTPTPSIRPAPTATAPPAPLFTVPKSWRKLKSSHSQIGLVDLGSYIFARNGYTQGFNVLEAASAGLDADTIAKINLTDLEKTEKHFRLISQQTIPLCSGQHGRLITYQADDAPKRLTFEQLFAASGTKGYVVTYSRASSQQDEPQALAALRSLCPPLLPAVAADTSPVPFSPPPSWQRVNPAAMQTDVEGILAVWIHPSGGRVPDTLNVVKSDSHVGSLASTGLGDVLDSAVKQKFPGAVMRRSHAETVCNGTAAGWYLEYNLNMKGIDFIIEQAVVFAENVQYAATYARAATQPEDPAARHALDTLCPAGAQISS